MSKLTTEEFIEKAKKIHGDKYDYSKVNYVRSSEKVCIICPDHGEFWQIANCHLQGQNCPKCSAINRINSLKCSQEELISRFRKIHGNLYEYDFSNYTTINGYLDIKCLKHNYWFKQKTSHHLSGHGCPICFSGKKMTTEEFIIKAREVHGNTYDYSKVVYNGKDIPVEIICPSHGSFWQKPHNHISGCGCPNCKPLKTQQKIYEFLCKSFPNVDWKWECSPEWLKPQRFDIYSYKHNLAIEYNGKQHYVPLKCFGGQLSFNDTVRRDALKSNKCADNNCKLYIIKYDNIDYDKIKEDINNLINNT